MADVETYLSPAASTIVGASGAFGAGIMFAKWFLEYVGGRMDKRAAALDAGIQRLIEGLEKRVNDLTDRLDVVEQDLANCERKHAQAAAEVMQLKAFQQGFSEARDRAQAIIAAERLESRQVKP